MLNCLRNITIKKHYTELVWIDDWRNVWSNTHQWFDNVSWADAVWFPWSLYDVWTHTTWCSCSGPFCTDRTQPMSSMLTLQTPPGTMWVLTFTQDLWLGMYIDNFDTIRKQEGHILQMNVNQEKSSVTIGLPLGYIYITYRLTLDIYI